MSRYWVALALVGLLAGAAAAPAVTLNEAEFRDKVLACWMGKSIGGTLGMPFEGQREMHDLTFFANLKPGEPAANDDLDLQLLWLKAVEEHAGRIDARILGEYWLQFVPVDWNEYGVGKRNLRAGLLPPLSGEYRNAQWKHSNGAWIRTEIWACLAPGQPLLAAQLAREDACVDHGSAEGTLAAIFVAAIESAAFLETDVHRLLDLGLACIPAASELARAVRAVRAAHAAGRDWITARQEILDATAGTGWFQAPRNVAFVVLGWLYGQGDWGKSLCLAVNCGDDTDCTGATLGSILGILRGTHGIPAEWAEPVGRSIRNVAISGFRAPADLDELTDRTLAMTRRVLALRGAPVALRPGPTDLRDAAAALQIDRVAANELCTRSPYRVIWTEGDAEVRLDYRADPEIAPDTPRELTVSVRNLSPAARRYGLQIAGLLAGWRATGLPPRALAVAPGEAVTVRFNLTAEHVEPVAYPLRLIVTGPAMPISVPLALFGVDAVGADDLALARRGATIACDGEYAQEPGCAQEAIDGILSTPDDFSNRWHSDLARAMPHWIEVKLPQPARIGRIVLRFADPRGHPTSFQGLIYPPGDGEPTIVFDETAYGDNRIYRRPIDGVLGERFRLVIRESANPAYPNAAQLSEIEIYAAE